jgi:hypothetical protein
LLPFTGVHSWLDYPLVLANMGVVLSTHDSVSPTVWLSSITGLSVARVIITVLGMSLVIYAARMLPFAASFAVAVTVSVLIAPAVFHHYLTVLIVPLLLALAAGVRPWIVAVAYFLMWGGQQPALGDWAWVLSRVPQTLGWLVLLFALLRVKAVPEGARGSAIAAPATA